MLHWVYVMLMLSILSFTNSSSCYCSSWFGKKQREPGRLPRFLNLSTRFPPQHTPPPPSHVSPPPSFPPPSYSTGSSTSSTSSSSTGGGGGQDDGLVVQFLSLQNQARADVQVPPLQWDAELQSYAQWWADKRALDCQLLHSSGPFGENIYVGSGSGESAVQCWIDEGQYYNYASNTCDVNGLSRSLCVSDDCGHYTQVVWNTSTKIGCAVVSCNPQTIFAICNYNPPGNCEGEKPY